MYGVTFAIFNKKNREGVDFETYLMIIDHLECFLAPGHEKYTNFSFQGVRKINKHTRIARVSRKLSPPHKTTCFDNRRRTIRRWRHNSQQVSNRVVFVSLWRYALTKRCLKYDFGYKLHYKYYETCWLNQCNVQVQLWHRA